MRLHRKHFSALLLLLASGIWGFAFVAQSVGMDYVGPFTFNAIRNMIGGLVLLPVIALRSAVRVHDREDRPERKKTGPDRNLLKGGLICGVFLCMASNLQQAGIVYTSVGKAGFITAMYIVLVPLLGIFFGRRIGWKIWASVALTVLGLYFLCISGSLSLNRGDVLMAGCALCFSFQIMAVDRYAPLTDGVKLACTEFWVCGLITAVLMFVFEKPQFSSIMAAAWPILYAGALSCGIAYTFQILGQRNINPAVASLIMSLESVISALGGWLILKQSLSARELAGCAIMFAAILLAQFEG